MNKTRVITAIAVALLGIAGPALATPAQAQSSIKSRECTRTGGQVVQKSGHQVCVHSRRYADNTPVRG